MRKARVYVVTGAPASGKSTLGAALARRLHAALLDQDVLTGPLTAVVGELVGASPGDLDDPRLRALTRKATYDALVDTAVDCLSAGLTTVLVAPFTTERSDPQAWAALVKRLGGAVLIWATCPPEELLRRMAERAAPRDRRKLAGPDSFLGETALAPPVVPHLVVDTTLPLTEQLDSLNTVADKESEC